jgi:hydroxyacylglutathione hydrolase
MKIEQIRTGGDKNFAYIIGDEKTGLCAVVDPSFSPKLVVKRASEMKLRIKFIFSTHRHHDHINGNSVIEEMTGITPILFGEKISGSTIELKDELIPILLINLAHVPTFCL